MGRGQDGAGRWWCGGWKSQELDDHVLLLARKPADKIYFPDRSAYSAAGKYVDRSWENINRSQTDECGNWD
jgi:hypothetical protein